MTRSFTPLALALVLSTLIAAVAWTQIKNKSTAVIDVTGSAKKRITSDLIEWTASVSVENKDRVEGYKSLKGQVEQTLLYLKAQGIVDAEVRTSAVNTSEISTTETVLVGGERIERETDKRWLAEQGIVVSSSDVTKVERLSREVTQLLEKGVPIVSTAPKYLYTKLGELKVEMLAEASKDARTRAERIISSAGGSSKLGALSSVDMGIINVNAANSTDASWQGNNDVSSLEKDIITVVHVRYKIDD